MPNSRSKRAMSEASLRTRTHWLRPAGAAVAVALAFTGCGRGDTRVNSDPGPGRPSAADTGSPIVSSEYNPVKPAPVANPGTDATGRPSDASGGTTKADSASQPTGTKVESSGDPRK
jgi:hypothetical protein